MANFPFFSDIDLNNNQLFKSRWENLSSAPSSPGDGRFYFDTTTKLFRGWNGTNWSNFNNGFSTVSELTVSSGSTSINLANGVMFNLTLTTNTTISAISGVPSGIQGIEILLKVEQNSTGNYTLTLPGNFTLTGSINANPNSNSIIKLITFNSGTNWEAIVLKPSPGADVLWTPANISTAIWLDFTDTSTIAIGSGISQINDKSGNNRHATQATASQQPSLVSNVVNGNSVGRFVSSSTQKLSFNGSFIANTNYLIVAAFSCSVAGGAIIGGATSGNDQNLTITRNSNSIFYSQFSNDHTWNTSTASGSFEIVSIINSSTSGKAGYHNGNSIGSNANTTLLSSWNGAALGHRSDADWRFNGDIAEFIICTGANANTTNQQLLEGYMAHRLNLANNLPSGHPYKNSAPTV